MSIDFLQERIRKLKNPTRVGLDPYLPILPNHIVRDAFDRDGQTLAGAAAAYGRFCTELLDALKELVPAVKIQSACFEALGADGIAQMQRISAYAKDLGYYVLIDSMRGDVGNIAEIHAQAMFGTVPVGETAHQIYRCDALTVNGYLGSDGVKPYLPYCKNDGKNIFLLLKTSNKSSREVQDLLSGDRVIYTAMADLAMRWSTNLFGRSGYSEIGAVVGATYPEQGAALRKRLPHTFFLVPGYGAQGATGKDLRGCFDANARGAVVNASRSILTAWKKQPGVDFAQAARNEAIRMRDDIMEGM